MYKVVEVFVKYNEDWARLQKSETQFRAKEYLVKCVEILRVPVSTVDIEDDGESFEEDDVPDVQDKAVDKIPVKFDGIQPSATKDVHDAEHEEDTHELPDDRTSTSYGERPKRRAAGKSRDNIKEMVAAGILKINRKETPKPPTHAWDWNTFRDLLEAEDSVTIIRSVIDPVVEEVSLDETITSSGTDSPTQTPTPRSPIQVPDEPQQFDDGNPDQNLEDHGRDTPRRSQRFLGNTTNWATFDAFGRK